MGGAIFGLVWLTRKNVVVRRRTGVEAAVTRAIYVWLIVAGVPLHWEIKGRLTATPQT